MSSHEPGEGKPSARELFILLNPADNTHDEGASALFVRPENIREVIAHPDGPTGVVLTNGTYWMVHDTPQSIVEWVEDHAWANFMWEPE